VYRERWQVEQFFRALKQSLRIKTFVGTSANAVLVQIWTALINVGQSPLSFLQNSLENVDTRRGQVWPWQWNDVKKCAIIPGSAIKGSIRTALLSAKVASTANKEPEWKKKWQDTIHKAPPNRIPCVAQELEQEVIRGVKAIEHDLFRFIKVSDVDVPAQFVRVDRAMLLSKSAQEATAKIQMHYERLVSLCDGSIVPKLHFTLSIEKQEKEWNQGIKTYLVCVPEKNYLLQCLRSHFDTCLYKEKNGFRELYDYKRWQQWRQDCKNDNRSLIRIGRFSHFEALSVETLRATYNRKHQLVQEGTSRTYCLTENNRMMPFGWAILEIS
jgi:CRISPR type III-A-associated RAMP protein Csm5